MTVRPEAQDIPRWLESGSDASGELRALAREASELPDDVVRIARLRTRLGPWLAVGSAAEALRPEAPAPQPLASSAPAAAGPTLLAQAAAVAVGTSVAVASVLSWLGPATPALPRSPAVSAPAT